MIERQITRLPYITGNDTATNADQSPFRCTAYYERNRMAPNKCSHTDKLEVANILSCKTELFTQG